MALFPNPANNIIQFTGIHPEIRQTEIFTTDGKLIHKAMFNDSMNPTMDISMLRNGMYFMKVQFLNGKTVVLKFIKSGN
ncbi:MAG: T9SS type A sorting domain-containing protein [Deltaproteobacteria bacterium]|nr:T9SS type A sorting domain-containing protein [Deltaproteobacteria bacterium]